MNLWAQSYSDRLILFAFLYETVFVMMFLVVQIVFCEVCLSCFCDDFSRGTNNFLRDLLLFLLSAVPQINLAFLGKRGGSILLKIILHPLTIHSCFALNMQARISPKLSILVFSTQHLFTLRSRSSLEDRNFDGMQTECRRRFCWNWFNLTLKWCWLNFRFRSYKNITIFSEKCRVLQNPIWVLKSPLYRI